MKYKVVFFIVDRELGYIIMKPDTIPVSRGASGDHWAIGQFNIVDLELGEGVDLERARADNTLLWVQTDFPDGSIGIFVSEEHADWNAINILYGPSDQYVIPACEILDTYQDYIATCCQHSQ